MAKKPIHIDETPVTLRITCSRQFLGRSERCVSSAQPKRSTTEGVPRNRTICERLACRSDANLIQAPIAANIRLARSIHKDCIDRTGIEGKSAERELRHPTSSTLSEVQAPVKTWKMNTILPCLGHLAVLAGNQRIPWRSDSFQRGNRPNIPIRPSCSQSEILQIMKRIILFLMTNLAVMLVLSATMTVLGAGRYLTAQGLDLTQLLIFAAIIGFTGSIISLLISKPMAKASTGARVIDPQAPSNAREAWLVDTVHQLADRAGIGRPEVAIYEGAPNAFATGAFKNDALVAVSTGLLQSMSEEEVAAVLGHEVAHIANGDMITLTLIQGVVNTFVIFMS